MESKGDVGYGRPCFSLDRLKSSIKFSSLVSASTSSVELKRWYLANWLSFAKFIKWTLLSTPISFFFKTTQFLLLNKSLPDIRTVFGCFNRYLILIIIKACVGTKISLKSWKSMQVILDNEKQVGLRLPSVNIILKYADFMNLFTAAKIRKFCYSFLPFVWSIWIRNSHKAGAVICQLVEKIGLWLHQIF